MLKYRQQKGFLLLSAIIIIVAVSFMAATAAYIFTTNARANAEQQLTTDAFYIAQSGLHVGMNRYMGNDASQQLACSAITGTPALTNTSFGMGEFTVTATQFSPASTTLPVAINDSVTTIRINSAAGYAASSGAVVIGSEMIDYASIGTTGGACGGTAPCLLGATRGAAGTTAAAHSSGATVSQNFCQISSTAYVPSAANPIASRTVQENAIKASSDVWAVGNNFGGHGVIEQYDGSSAWNQYNPGGVENQDLYGVFLLSESSGWIVGDRDVDDCDDDVDDTRALFLRFDGSNWNRVCGEGGLNSDYRSVHCVNDNYCVAVGEEREQFAVWTGGPTWEAMPVDTSSNYVGGVGEVKDVTYNSVFCNNTANCWAVGQKKNGRGATAFWNGTEWKGIISGSVPNEHLQSVWCTAIDSCWAVGDDETFIFYDGSSWSDAGVSVSGGVGGNGNNRLEIYGVTCVQAGDCWAVGKRRSLSGSYWKLTGPNAWTRQTGATVNTTANKHVFAVFCLESDQCYATGDGGTAATYNGTIWTNASAGLFNTDMNAVHGVQSDLGVNRVFGWQEQFN